MKTTKMVVAATLVLLVASIALSFIPLGSCATNYYEFKGPIDELNLNQYLSGNVTVTPHNLSPTFNFTTTYDYNVSEVLPVRYFGFDWNGTGTNQHREYWLDTVEYADQKIENLGGEFNIMFTNTALTTYVISFQDYVGVLKLYPFVEVQVSNQGVYMTVEKRMVDMQNIVSFNLIQGQNYRLVFTDGTTDYVYGDLTTTATTGIQLVVRGVDFPKETILKYQYVHASAYRDFLNPTGSITVSYEDITNATSSVNVAIVNATSNIAAFNTTFSGVGNQTFSYTWSAANATSYKVIVTTNHTVYGVFHYDFYLTGEHVVSSNPFSLEFLGSISGVDTAMFIPALIIIMVAGVFSQLTAEVACFLTSVTAIILVIIGWVSISSSMLVVALSLSVLAGVVAVRRRFV